MIRAPRYLRQPAPGTRRERSSLKALLVVLVTLMLVLLFWQLHQEGARLEQIQRERSEEHAARLAEQFAMILRLKAEAGRTFLTSHASRPTPAEQQDALLQHLRGIFPALHSLAWIDNRGRVLSDSATPVATLVPWPRQAFHASYRSGLVLISLHAADHPGGWLIRLTPAALSNWLATQPDGLSWQLVSAGNAQPLLTQGPQDRHNSIIASFPINGSDWQVQALFDADHLQDQIHPLQAGKLLVLILFAALALLAVFGLLREQRSLLRSQALSRKALEDAIGALGAIHERVLVTQPDGHVSYLNPRAEQMFGLGLGVASQMHIVRLLPALAPWMENSLHEPDAPIEVMLNGAIHLFEVTCHCLYTDDDEPSRAWVLRDVSEQERAMRVLHDTRRRYQEIFEGSGVALCVLDLHNLRTFLDSHELHHSDQLMSWLDADQTRHAELLGQIRIAEVNRVTLQLLGVETPDEAWRQLIGHHPLRAGGARFNLIATLLDGHRDLMAETQARTPQGQERYLLLTLRLPKRREDLRAVTLSLHDITSRKRVELSLAERERFWSEVLRAVPDSLYVHDMSTDQQLYSNNRLGPALGYSAEELEQLGKRFWEKLLHPDDAELYQRLRNLEKVVGQDQLLQVQLRWRHRDGSWHWFELREHALNRDRHGRVSRLIGVAKDITGDIAAQARLSDSERRYRMLAEGISDVIVSSNSELQINYISPSMHSVLGYAPEQLLPNGLLRLLANPRQLAGMLQVLGEVRASLGNRERLQRQQQKLAERTFVLDCLRADGHKVVMEMRLSLLWDEQDRFEGLLSIGRDVTQQRRAERDLRMAATVFEHSTAAIMVTDPAGYIVRSNETFQRITGYSGADVLDQKPQLLTADRQQAAQFAYIVRQLGQHGSWEVELWLKRKTGEQFPAWVGITAVQDDEGDLVSYVCFFNDISERKASEQRIHRLAYYDALTLLPNRTLFQDRLHTALQHAERHDEWVVLMFLDLDRFKPINDSLGHAAGDRMLKDVAVRLAACVDEDDTVARMGGDEFTLLLQPRQTRESALTRAIHVGEQILASLAQPFILQGREFFVTASIGIALGPQDGNELSLLMKNADTAMYYAKERGKNNFQFYQSEMNATALQRLELESDLRHALEQQQFQLFYQPQLSGDGRRLTGVEALLRWQHPRRGLVAPTEFIPVLEEIGLISQVGDWVIAEACRQLQDWRSSGLRVPKVSVNLSARQFSDGQLAMRISRALRDSGLPPAALELELTESILMRDVSETMLVLNSLKRLGLCIAVDDFGTGYSSLNYLKQFPIDVLKIDRSFVDGLPGGEQDAQIARAIIAMAHSLGLAVIAEGVENQDQLDFLREHDCDQVQGYLFGKPMPASHFEAQFGSQALFILS